MKRFDRPPFDFDGNGKTDIFEFALGMELMNKLMNPDDDDDENDEFGDENEEDDGL